MEAVSQTPDVPQAVKSFDLVLIIVQSFWIELQIRPKSSNNRVSYSSNQEFKVICFNFQSNLELTETVSMWNTSSKPARSSTLKSSTSANLHRKRRGRGKTWLAACFLACGEDVSCNLLCFSWFSTDEMRNAIFSPECVPKPCTPCFAYIRNPSTVLK